VNTTNLDSGTDDVKLDPFDPAALRLDQSFAGAGVKKLLTTVPVRKPGRQDFVRVHPGEDYRLTTAIVELKEEREFYLITPQNHPCNYWRVRGRDALHHDQQAGRS
jgi:hypothetical protein